MHEILVVITLLLTSWRRKYLCMHYSWWWFSRYHLYFTCTGASPVIPFNFWDNQLISEGAELNLLFAISHHFFRYQDSFTRYGNEQNNWLVVYCPLIMRLANHIMESVIDSQNLIIVSWVFSWLYSIYVYIKWISLSFVNTLRPRHNGLHLPDDILKCIFLNEIVSISIKISLKFVPKGPIDNIPILVQIMAWRRTGHYLKQWW